MPKRREAEEGFTPEQAAAFEVIINVAAKFLLAMVCAVVLLLVTGKALFSGISWPIAFVEGLLIHTVYRVFKHYFK